MRSRRNCPSFGQEFDVINSCLSRFTYSLMRASTNTLTTTTKKVSSTVAIEYVDDIDVLTITAPAVNSQVNICTGGRVMRSRRNC